VVSFPQISPPKSCTHLYSLPYVLHSPPIYHSTLRNIPEKRADLIYSAAEASNHAYIFWKFIWKLQSFYCPAHKGKYTRSHVLCVYACAPHLFSGIAWIIFTKPVMALTSAEAVPNSWNITQRKHGLTQRQLWNRMLV